MNHVRSTRRKFLECIGLTAVSSGFLASPANSAPPEVLNPRATDGDERFEPDWDERVTVTVGHKNADLIGSSDRVLQAAVDYVARLGGGTIQILPGTYTLRNAVSLPSKIRLLGSGAESIITKIPSESVNLAADSDWYDQEVTLESASNFRVGDGVVLRSKNPDNGSQTVVKRTLVARSGARFKLNDGLRANLWLTGKPTCSSLFPLLTSEYTSDVWIENLTLDGNRDNNENFNGNYGGCIFLQDCNRYTLRGVTTRNYNGDGISFQICHDVVVENCHSHDNADLGVHPGSGSQRPLIRNNRLERNNLGLFWCWGVKYGLAEGNVMDSNRSYGISIGHCDTDNVMRNNEIRNSGKIGILFRDDSRGQDFWANRNLVEGNKIIDSGGEEGVAIDITGRTKDVRIVNNEIRETRMPMQRTAVRIGAEAGSVELTDNRIEGFASDVVDHRRSS
ncbi:MAG: right-handed parallel beta-helix repeat-containing protein [Planctomycetaceae bacterium]|nr:right-handed parallel beta-helix repeat-containing protein [Planctomycetales bacterium]MCB9921949.1 right-handed parallel beta-helix repeat-containing protein [Planctomycetaceae bacterium]